MIELYDDPDAFLAVAEDHLRADPVVSTVLATATLADRRDRADGVPLPHRPRWWAVSRTGSEVTGCAFRSPTPFPPYLLPMPDRDARALARALHERCEDVRGASGATEACEAFAAGWSALTGARSRALVWSRLFEAPAIEPPAGVPGELRRAGAADLDVVVDHLAGFQHDAEVQAGRDGSARAYDDLDRDAALRRIRAGEFWVWSVDGQVVSSVGGHDDVFGASRVGPVYTPPQHRRHGYAAAATAALSQRLLDRGVRPCLFTDLANPTSNGIYTRIGFRPVRDTVELTFTDRTDRTDWAHALA
ncbi:GNAT family N-acetyltransferase [Nocardioides marmoribigeumensis]|uniref:GNAT superfamily N-acetyltransferase n=1 Tax=Nocardioides marmoribigeumensis TaxID=433649 RepID=A0ABU2BRY6_9ACTN|nr:GNAT family N-acetyltransferase [Nocardioides marmoribigeumensis]MDR7361392.1 GNAT superfamily N-acetyltransferase [Nocardioides marmoribigeumensis]